MGSLFVQLAKKLQCSSNGGRPSVFESLQQAASQAKSDLSLAEWDSLLEQLSNYRKEAEQTEREGDMDLLLQFLQHSREDKSRKLEALQRELACLDNDIGRVESTVEPNVERTGASFINTGAGGFTAPAGTDPGPSSGLALETAGPPIATQAMQQAALATAQHQQLRQQRAPGSTTGPWSSEYQNIGTQNFTGGAGEFDTRAATAAGMGAGALPPLPVDPTLVHRTDQQYSAAAYTALAGHPGMATFMATQFGGAAGAAATGGMTAPVGGGIGVGTGAGAGASNGVLGLSLASPSSSVSEEKKEPGVGLFHTHKRRRIAAQFEDLQSAYLRLRADRLKGTSTSNTGNGGDAMLPTAGAAESPMTGAIVDEGLQEFSRLLSVLSRYNRLVPIAEIPRPSLRQASSIISSVEFDREGTLFATAGVSKRISVFEHAAVLRSPGTLVHCPVVEMVTRSKLSCLTWNKYMSSHLASSDYEGVVTVWDVNTSGMVQEYEAHAKRIWSVDFCGADPSLLASGSDDCTVKLWSTRAQASVAQLDLKANVCAVKWRPGSAHQLAIGSADHIVYLYDLRKPAAPLASFSGHKKAVSYVRWAGENEIASASTDSTLRLWDAASAVSSGIGGEAVRIYEGHANEKNFVGLGVEGEFLACGSETNEAYVYFKPLSKPVARLGFGDGVPFGSGAAGVGGDGNDGGGGAGIGEDKTFVSAVCWRPGGQELLVADSQGTIRVLQLAGSG